MTAIRAYETELARHLLAGLAERPQFKVWGITDPKRLNERVPTISMTHPKKTAEELAKHLAERQIYTWNGNMYALELSERLGLEARGGFLRLGLVHYNTVEEIDHLITALDELPAR
jgi:selenocysteine lyase/cysteine desulfurase